MIEKGKVVSIKGAVVEIEIPTNYNCKDCNACLAVPPSQRIITVNNDHNIKIGDKVKVFIYQNKIKSGFFLYIFPLLFFFCFMIISMRWLKVKNEGISALFGFSGFFIAYLIVKIFSGKLKVRNQIIEIDNG